MLTFFKKKGQQLNAGIDVGSAYIKAAVIDKSDAAPQLIAFSYEPLTGSATSSLKKAVAKLAGVSGIGANTSISGPSTIVRIIEMPTMTERELKSAAKFEAEKYIPYKTDEVITDCIKVEDSTGGKINALLVAAKKAVINSRISLLSEAGLSANIIDIDSFAVINAFLNSQKPNADTAYALINIGAKMTNISIVKGAHPYLARDIQIGGDDITNAIAEKLNLPKDKAEALKINPSKDKNEIMPITKSVFYTLMNEIRLSFDFYENHYGKAVNTVYVSGGSSRLEGLTDYIKDIFNGEVALWDPFMNITLNPEIDKAALGPIKSSFAVAVGLALREA